ncbi:hypothetical protein K525DRAFT_272270 [Schizophyllum commune Loenen D]|nr:hypothetical protein K525DRAFT_272270 [Schizophyllum commune Loenen D]
MASKRRVNVRSGQPNVEVTGQPRGILKPQDRWRRAFTEPTFPGSVFSCFEGLSFGRET